MKLIYIVLAFVALVSTETPNDLVTEKLKTVDIREIVEGWIPFISQYIMKNHLDSYALESFETEFWLPFPGIPLISYKAYLNMCSGELKGLSNLNFNDALLTYEKRVITLATNIEFPSLMVAYNYDLKLRILKPKGIITADAKATRANIIITFNTTDYTLALDEFQLQSLKITNVVIQNQTGLKYWISSFVANILVAFCKDKITKNVQTVVAEAIRGYLDEMSRNVSSDVLAQFFQEKLLRLGLGTIDSDGHCTDADLLIV